MLDHEDDNKRKSLKIDTLKEIVHSFQQEIKNFEHYQEAASRDIEKLKMKSEMYKNLYEKERAEKMLKSAQLQKFKVMESQTVSTILAENNYNSIIDQNQHSPLQTQAQTNQYQTLPNYSKNNDWQCNTMSVNLRNLSHEENFSPEFCLTGPAHSHKVSQVPQYEQHPRSIFPTQAQTPTEVRRTSMSPITPKDYYVRLQDMQTRLEAARSYLASVDPVAEGRGCVAEVNFK